MSNPNDFIVIVPGYMGSKLRDKRTGEIVWLDVPAILSDLNHLGERVRGLFDALRYPNPNIEPAGLLNQIVFAPPFLKQDHYGRLVEALQKLGCALADQIIPGKISIHAFSYDWRQDNRISARQLAAAVHGWRGRHNGGKAWIVAHSNGGIVSRWYIEKEGGKNDVAQLFLMASPWDGAPATMQTMMDGMDMFITRLLGAYIDVNGLMRQTMLTFPSFYQIVPWKTDFLQSKRGETINPFENTRWLQDATQRALLADAKKFNEDLGLTLSVKTNCFIGVQKTTTVGGVVTFAPGGAWQDVEWKTSSEGDGTIAQYSGTHPNAQEKITFVAGHGDVYVGRPALGRLGEVLGLVAPGPEALSIVAVTGGMRIEFDCEDAVRHGEPLHLWATLANEATGAPISKARVAAQLQLRQPLRKTTRPAPKPRLRLLRETATPGRYECQVTAPSLPGYYRVIAQVSLGGGPPIEVEELVLVDM